ncbi:MAG TPA: class I SAM-dependent methyltransferase [Cyclobacteriaceae bacterium]|jgi:predicted O-methyltransferase YrrM|nr:class I SAM-dependent methyltransferase [Cyclobacteriaceae bacterium]
MNKAAKDYIDDFYSENIKLGFDNSKHDIFFSSLRKVEAETLSSLVKKFKPVSTLEIGLAMGASAVAIAGGKVAIGVTDPHIVLDPFQHTRAKDAGLLEIKRLGLEKAVTFYPRYSEDFLNECFQKKQEFDFIFVDGSHTIGQAVTDVFLSDKVLKRNGIIAVHDSLLFSTAASIKYLIRERDYKIVFEKDIDLRSLVRMVRYPHKLGLGYAWDVIPRIKKSVLALQKN